MMTWKRAAGGFALFIAVALPGSRVTRAAGVAQANGQASEPANKLLTGKMIYVAPMPDNLDQWITQSLTAWQRYKVTANPEGVDIVFRAVIPDEDTRLKLRRGVPQPARQRKGPPTPSVKVLDWVTGAILWQADIVDKKVKEGAPAPPPGAHVQILARGLSTDRLGAKVARAFREYVESLGKGVTR
ncbi:MAG TPA: hypothetical protein VGW33_06100 [Terriglobia bacterium]|nr:hypothetical protein [Terriglobia bacterium]